MCQRDHRRFEAALVTCRRVHVTKLSCATHQHPPAHTGMNAQSPHSFQGLSRSNFSRAVSRHASRRSSICPVDMRLLARESGARVERSVGADRVRVLHVHVAGPVVDAVGRGKPARSVSSRRNVILSSSEVARVARRRRAPAPADVMHVPPSGLAHAVALDRRSAAGSALLAFGGAGRSGATDDRLEVHLDQLVGEILLLQELEERRIAVDRALVEVAADGDARTCRRRGGCSRRCGRTCPGRRAAAACGCACRGRRRA